MVSPLARRAQVALARERGLSLRRACGLIGMSRSTPSYEPRLPAKDAPVIEAMKELSAQYPRYGYRRIRMFLRRRGVELSWSRTHRLWRQAGLLVPKKRSHKRIASTRPCVHTPFKANMVWAYDFVFDTTASGQQVSSAALLLGFGGESASGDDGQRLGLQVKALCQVATPLEDQARSYPTLYTANQ